MKNPLIYLALKLDYIKLVDQLNINCRWSNRTLANHYQILFHLNVYDVYIALCKVNQRESTQQLTNKLSVYELFFT